MGIVGLLLPLVFVVALGAWLSGFEASRRRRSVAVLGAVTVSGLLLYVLFGGPPTDALERTGVGCLFALPAVAAALVAFRSGPWTRPWLAILLSLIAYATGCVLAVNVWMWLGLPH